MAHKRMRSYSAIEDVRELSRRTVKGCDSERDRTLFCESLILRYHLLKDLFPDDPSPSLGYRRALFSCRELDAKAVFSDYKQLRELIVSRGFRQSESDCYRLLDQAYERVHYKWTVTPLKCVFTHGLSVLSYRKALQWVSFDSKLNFKDSDYSTELCVEYLDDEYKLHHQAVDQNLLHYLNKIMKEWFSDCVPELHKYHFCHTSGATAELKRREATRDRKNYSLYVPPQLKRYMEFRCSQDFCSFDWWFNPISVARPLPSEVQFVPKTPLTNRVISKEPTAMMYCQSDLRSILVETIRSKRLPIYLEHQEYSRNLAQKGSADGSYDTLDLSKASDYVTLSHVSAIFADTPVHDLLLCCRTPTAHVTDKSGTIDETVELEKFAPMGSNICFPVESLVFAVICEAAVRLVSGRKSDTNEYLVYGDDIVINSRYTAKLRLLLSLCRFVVNDDKSFTDKSTLTFREACGLEAVNGIEVTPLRISRRYCGALNVGLSTSGKIAMPPPSEAMGICDFINRCCIYGFMNLRRSVLDLTGKWILKLNFCDYYEYKVNELCINQGHPLIFQHPVPTIISADGTSTNYGSRSRYGSSPTPWIFQRQVVTVSSKVEIIDSDESAYHTYWTLSSFQEDVDERYASGETYAERLVYNGGSSVRWRKQWVSIR